MELSDVPKSRLGYCFIFTMHIILVWVCRDVLAYNMQDFFGSVQVVIRQFNCSDTDCYGEQLVTRLCFTYFLWHFILGLCCIPRNEQQEAYLWQVDLHNSGWWFKLPLLLLGYTVVVLFFPHIFFDYFFYPAAAGGGIFLVIQAIFVVDLSYWWSESWSDPDSDATAAQLPWACLIHLTTVIFYFLSVGVSIFLAIYYTFPASLCWPNIFVLAETTFTCFVISLISSHHKIERGNLFISSIVCLYVVLVIASAIGGETESTCNQLENESYNFLTVAGALSGLIFVFYGALFYFVAKRNLVPKPDKLPYDFTKFHLLFAFGAMYIGMVFTDWRQDEEATTGAFPFWIKFGVQSVTLLLYGWALIAPLVLRAVLGDGEVQKLVQEPHYTVRVQSYP